MCNFVNYCKTDSAQAQDRFSASARQIQRKRKTDSAQVFGDNSLHIPEYMIFCARQIQRNSAQDIHRKSTELSTNPARQIQRKKGFN